MRFIQKKLVQKKESFCFTKYRVVFWRRHRERVSNCNGAVIGPASKICLTTSVFDIMENYKDIKGFEGEYQISTFGNVRSVERLVFNTNKSKRLLKSRVLKANKKSNGYLSIKIKGKHFYIHRLVALAFYGVDNKREFVNHIDGDKENNNIINLEWCTRSENTIHKYDVLRQKGVRRKLKKEEVLYIRKNHKKGFGGNTKELAKKFNICEGSILTTVKRKYYDEY